MDFLIESSRDVTLPQEAMRRIVEAVDGYRGQNQVFVVFQDREPYEVDSVHLNQQQAQARARGGAGLSYLGPIAPLPATRVDIVAKKTGCLCVPIRDAVSKVVLLGSREEEVRQFSVTGQGRNVNPDTDIEALFLNSSGIDKFLVPYLTRVFGADYATARRREWIR
jgi:hypothetical protein